MTKKQDRSFWFKVTRSDPHGLHVKELRAVQAKNKREAIQKSFPNANKKVLEVKQIKYCRVQRWSLE